jgi:hypothetical protein
MRQGISPNYAFAVDGRRTGVRLDDGGNPGRRHRGLAESASFEITRPVLARGRQSVADDVAGGASLTNRLGIYCRWLSQPQPPIPGTGSPR